MFFKEQSPRRELMIIKQLSDIDLIKDLDYELIDNPTFFSQIKYYGKKFNDSINSLFKTVVLSIGYFYIKRDDY